MAALTARRIFAQIDIRAVYLGEMLPTARLEPLADCPLASPPADLVARVCSCTAPWIAVSIALPQQVSADADFRVVFDRGQGRSMPPADDADSSNQRPPHLGATCAQHLAIMMRHQLPAPTLMPKAKGHLSTQPCPRHHADASPVAHRSRAAMTVTMSNNVPWPPAPT